MTTFELLQVLARYNPDTEVCVSQKPEGYVVSIRWHELEDGILKLYGDGSVTPEGDEPTATR